MHRLQDVSSELFDIIIDNGSHLPLDVILMFEVLWGYFHRGGIYVIEDVIVSYWPHLEGS